jgi:hypothetical protein
MHMSNVITAFYLDGWEITFCHNWKGTQIHASNPRIKKHEYFESGAKNITEKQLKAQVDRLDRAKNDFDRVVIFQKSLEYALIAPEHSPEYFWPLKVRRAKNTNICYYDQSMIWAGFTESRYMGWTGEVYFTSDEHEQIKAWYRDKNIERKYIILWCLRGSMYQKAVYPLAKEICTAWLKEHPDSIIITTGDSFCQQWEWEDDKVINKSGRMPFRQALHMAAYSDMVVTPETGLGIGAGVFSTPKIMLLTAASLKNVVGNDKNDYSIQSSAWCSPCTRAIYNTDNCDLNSETGLPICVDFDKDEILAQMNLIRDNHGFCSLHKRLAPKSDKKVYM